MAAPQRFTLGASNYVPVDKSAAGLAAFQKEVDTRAPARTNRKPSKLWMGTGRIPRCPGGQHAMQVCADPSSTNRIYPTFWCDGCGVQGVGRRWHCLQHTVDFCITCREEPSEGVEEAHSASRNHQPSLCVKTSDSHCSTSSSFNPSESMGSSIDPSCDDPESPRFAAWDEHDARTPSQPGSFTSTSSALSTPRTKSSSSNSRISFAPLSSSSAAASAASTVRVSAITGRTPSTGCARKEEGSTVERGGEIPGSEVVALKLDTEKQYFVSTGSTRFVRLSANSDGHVTARHREVKLGHIAHMFGPC